MRNQKQYYTELTANPTTQQHFGQAFLPLRQQSTSFTNQHAGDYNRSQQEIEMIEQNELTVSQSAPETLLRKSGFETLEDREGLFLKQKLQVLGAITGCETQNTYFVYPSDEEAVKKGHKLFKCQEKSGFCIRNCISSNARPFKMEISTFRRGEDLKDEYEPFLQLERPCKCTFLCYKRQELLVTLVEDGKSEYLGKIVDPFTWCDLRTDVYDKDNAKTYSIEGSCCQLGVIYRAPCEPCQTVSFSIKDSSGEVVSKLQKKSPGCLKAAISDINNFSLNFPVNATAVDKALLLCSTLLLHYSYFEKNGGQCVWRL